MFSNISYPWKYSHSSLLFLQILKFENKQNGRNRNPIHPIQHYRC